MIAIACVDRVQRAREARVYGARLLGLPKIEKKIKNDSQPYRDGEFGSCVGYARVRVE